MLKITSEVDKEALAQRSGRSLGYAGLLPFWALPILVLAQNSFEPTVYQALLKWLILYGVVIVSFMGGSRWALSVISPDARPQSVFGGFLGAVMPALLAWFIILPEPILPSWNPQPVTQGMLLALLLGVIFLQDWSHSKRGGVPLWYMDLRTHLTIGASTPLILAALFNTIVSS